MHPPDELARREQPGNGLLARPLRPGGVPHDPPVSVHAYAPHGVVRHRRDPADVKHGARLFLGPRFFETRDERRVVEVRFVGQRTHPVRRRGVVLNKGLAQRPLETPPVSVCPRDVVNNLVPAEGSFQPRCDPRDAGNSLEQPFLEVQSDVLFRFQSAFFVEHQRELQRNAGAFPQTPRALFQICLVKHAPHHVITGAELVREPPAVPGQQNRPRASQKFCAQSFRRRGRGRRVHEPGGVDLCFFLVKKKVNVPSRE